MTTRRSLPLFLTPAVLALAPVLLAGCGEGPTEGEVPAASGASDAVTERTDWPEGTVLAVDSEPILVGEVDLASVWMERIQPQSTGRQLRRLALTNVVLPQALAILEAPEERERARAEAEAQLERLRAGEVPGPPNEDGGLGTVGEGNWQVLGIPLWGQAIDWTPDEWHLLEEPGRFVVARRLERVDRPHPTAIVIRIDSFLFPYLDDAAELESAKDRRKLTIVDPAWREIVPELTQYRMGAHGS